VGVRSKAHVCRGPIAGIAVSNLVEGMGVRLLCVLCGVQVAASAMSILLVHNSTTTCVRVCACVCVIVGDFESSTMRPPRPDVGYCAKEKKIGGKCQL
jgi:hypothetical protein